MRALALVSLLMIPVLARADVPAPQAPTVFLVIDGSALKTAAIQAAVKASLGALPSGVSLRVVGGRPLSGSAPLARTEAKKILAEVARAAVPPTLNSAKAGMLLATYLWLSGRGAGRHHIVLVGAGATDDLVDSLGDAVKDGFTVSLLSLRKLDAKEQKTFEERGAGHARSVTLRTLSAALRAELAWGKLSAAEEKKLAAARAARLARILGKAGGGGGLIGVLRGRGGAVGSVAGGTINNAVGVGGLGLRGRGYGSSTRLRRGEALVGPKLALAFREVVCKGCDVAEVRRAWLASAGPLLTCLEAAAGLGQGEVVVELSAAGKAVGPVAAASCAATWYSKQARSGVGGKLVVGPASSVR
jgi:hypothetical protein